jgi:hypothetical protein
MMRTGKKRTLMLCVAGALCAAPLARAQEAPAKGGPEQARMLELTNLLGFSGLFNLGRGTVRAVVLASPTCPGCAEAASGVLATLGEIESKRLRAYIVYAPALPGDTRLSALLSATKLPQDRRAVLFWDPDRVCASAWEPYLKADSTAVGATLLYDADAKLALAPPDPLWMQRHACVEGPSFHARAFAESTRVHVEALEAKVRENRTD